MYKYKRVYTGGIKVVIFDWAGTMVDFGSLAPVGGFMECFSQKGIELGVEEVRRFMGLGKREHIEKILRLPRILELWKEKYGARPSDRDVDQLYDLFVPAQQKRISDHADPIPGCLELMDALDKRGIAVGSTTGYPREVLEILSEKAVKKGLRPQSAVSVSDTARGRPWPDMVLQAALNLGLPDVRACLVVDDSPSGIQAGQAAGMWTAGVAVSGNEVGLSLSDWEGMDPAGQEALAVPARKRMAASGADFVIDSIKNLLPVIEAIDGRLKTG